MLPQTEDIIEEIIQEEIVGDDDQFIDDAAASAARPGVVRRNSKNYDPLALINRLAADGSTRENPTFRQQSSFMSEGL